MNPGEIMVNRQPVLVAIDHATNMTRALDVARSVAKSRGADVDVIQVVPQRGVHLDDRPRVWPVEPHDDGSVRFGSRLASTLRSGEDDRDVRRITLRGTPQDVIPAYSQLHQATLVVVERDYGSSRFWRNVRVVDDLARRSPIPLLVLPKRERPERDQSGLRRILTPVDFSIASAVALKTAVDLSRRHGARVTLVHAVEEVPRHMVFSGSEAWDVVRRLPAQLDAVADRLRRKAAFFGLSDVDTEVATGDADRAILETASRTDPDLVVMGIPHRSWLDRVVFGSTLRRVLRRATVPVLVIRAVAGAHTWTTDYGVDQTIRGGWTAESAGHRVAA